MFECKSIGFLTNEQEKDKIFTEKQLFGVQNASFFFAIRFIFIKN